MNGDVVGGVVIRLIEQAVKSVDVVLQSLS